MEKPSSTPSAQGAAQQVTREDLYELVWREPMLRVAERHAVSSSFLARVCSVMNVPRPPRGYWAKLEFGQALGAAAGQSQQLMQTFDLLSGAALAKLLSRLMRQSN